MIVELGHLALILALCLACAQSFFGLVGAQTRRAHWMAVARPAVAGQFVFTAIAFGCLVYAFEQNDFSVLYVASNSNTALPSFYRFTAVWGAHEGSMLLWLLVLSIWSAAVAAFSQRLPEAFVSRALGVLGLVSIGFGIFVLATSNPFERLIPAAADGRDLNPLLQDPAFVIHPPMTYLGYVGMSVPFAFAIAALLEGKLDAVWARWVRPWTTAAWMFLTCGILLGSWWAYYELGWGGWWFWDPVENSSFMPWLVGTALIHSLAVTEKRGLFKSWTLLLAIFAFSLSLLGTFLVRSGVLISVHSFASDPRRGAYILAFLVVAIGGALTVYTWRAPKFKSDAGFEMLSRESFLLMNNVLLVIAAALILFGTLYPLFLDAFNAAKLSVGPPYFNPVFLVPTLPLIFLVGIGMHSSWKRGNFASLRKPLTILFVAALLIALLVPLLVYGSTSVLTVIGISASVWIAASSLLEPISRWRRGQTLSRSVLGMCLAHFGLALFVLGVTVVKSYGLEPDLSLSVGQSVTVGDYQFKLLGLQNVEGPNYSAVQGNIEIDKHGERVAVVHPQKRGYHVQGTVLTHAGIVASLHRDLVVSMGDNLSGDTPSGAAAADVNRQTWSMRIQYKPMVRFIWLGALIMALGGLIAILDKRYRPAQVTSVAPTGAVASAK